MYFDEECEASVHYSIPKDSFGGDKNIMKNDWMCYKVCPLYSCCILLKVLFQLMTFSVESITLNVERNALRYE